MKPYSLLFMEGKRLFCRRLTWLVILGTAVSPAAGLFFYCPTEPSALGGCLANPSLAGGVGGGILFAALAVCEQDRCARQRMDALTDAVISPLAAALIRLSALFSAAAAALGISMLVWLPFTAAAAGAVFDGTAYLLCYLLFMGMALPISILLASAAWQATRRAGLSAVAFAALAGLSLTVWSGDWQLCWLNPCVWAVSDDFSNFRLFRSVGYMRLTWMLGAAGAWAVSWLCIRRYGRGIAGSFCINARRAIRPAAALLLLACCALLFWFQPFVDQSDPDLTAMTFYEMEPLPGVVCLGRTASLRPDLSAGTVSGTASYRFRNTSGREQAAAFGINPGYRITAASVNGRTVPVSMGERQESNMALATVNLPAEEESELILSYQGFPMEWNTMGTMQGELEISETYLYLPNQALAPYLFNVEGEGGRLPASVEIVLPERMAVIPFGTAEARAAAEEDGYVTWRYEDEGAGGILYAGDYVREDIAVSGMRVQFYYGRKHQPIMEAADASGAVRRVMEYCTEHFGPLPFAGSGSLKLIQSRVSGGGYAAAGASLLDEADFTRQNLEQADKGAVPGEVMIHELAHQWWGLGRMFDPEKPDGAWSAEGLAVYTTYRIVKEQHGEDYAREHYAKRWREAVDDYRFHFYVRHPEYLKALPEEQRLEISNSLSYVREYCEMPLKILKAEQLVGGEEAMDRILKELFCREMDPSAPYLTYQEFLEACGLREEELEL